MATAQQKDPKKKYVVFENILTAVNSKVIALQEKDTKRNNIILSVVTDLLIAKLKQVDLLFVGLYREKFYGGSFYDSLKVGHPNEYDLDLILHLPVITEPCISCSNQPGFVYVEVKQYAKILERPDAEKQRFVKLDTLLDKNNFLSTAKVLKWMEGIISKAMNELRTEGKEVCVDIVPDRSKPTEIIKIKAKITKGAPAFTLKLTGKDIDGSDIELDIDLVPCFSFDNKDWPKTSGGYRQNPSKNKTRFLVVPKKPREEHLANSPQIDKYWRLSFQEQEREIISGGSKKVLKPSLKLLKKLRDRHHHKIASYFIKTVFLWTIEKEDSRFWEQPLSVVFMAMLEKYKEHIRQKSIPYYWNKNYNLIGYLKEVTKVDIANTLTNIIQDVERNLDTDPYVIAKYLVSKEEFEQLKSEIKLSKKQEKQIQFSTANAILNSLSSDSVDSIISSSTPPLLQLSFDQQLLQAHRSYSDYFEENQKRQFQKMIAQISDVNGSVSSTDTVNYIKKIDEKLNMVLQLQDRILQQHEKLSAKVSNLEKKVDELLGKEKADGEKNLEKEDVFRFCGTEMSES